MFGELAGNIKLRWCLNLLESLWGEPKLNPGRDRASSERRRT